MAFYAWANALVCVDALTAMREQSHAMRGNLKCHAWLNATRGWMPRVVGCHVWLDATRGWMPRVVGCHA